MRRRLTGLWGFLKFLLRHDPSPGFFLSVLITTIVGIAAWTTDAFWRALVPEGRETALTAENTATVFKILVTLTVAASWFAYRCYVAWREVAGRSADDIARRKLQFRQLYGSYYDALRQIHQLLSRYHPKKLVLRGSGWSTSSWDLTQAFERYAEQTKNGLLADDKNITDLKLQADEKIQWIVYVGVFQNVAGKSDEEILAQRDAALGLLQQCTRLLDAKYLS